jgi:exodeoxyribonuclease VII large subunit
MQKPTNNTPAAFLPPQQSQKPYTISEINAGVAAILESGNTLVWVEGEISNFKRASSGHCYLTLKDAASQVPAVLWRSVAQTLPFEPQTGMAITAIASLRVYQKGGYYQLDIHRMQSSKLGALWAAFEKLKKQLDDEGLFDPAKKKPLPETVARLGVITSKRGAAVRDIITVARSRAPQIDIVVIDVPVQGDEAPHAIARAIADMNEYGDIDCIIVGRGGGSLEDLWAFNTEEVARAIFASRIPIISAVGHEIDFTIADFAADIRAPTPSAAAEMAVPDMRESLRYYESLAQRFIFRFRGIWADRRQRYARALARPALRVPLRLLADSRQTRDELADRLVTDMGRLRRDRLQRLSTAAARLHALSPLSVLSRGYSVVTDAGGKTIRSSHSLRAGDTIRLRFSEGKAGAQVTDAED